MTKRTFLINGREFALEEREDPLGEVDKSKKPVAGWSMTLPERYEPQVRDQRWVPSPSDQRDPSLLSAKLVTWPNDRVSFLTNQFSFRLRPGVALNDFLHHFPDVRLLRRVPFEKPVYLGRLGTSWGEEDHPERRLRQMIQSQLVEFAEPELIELVPPPVFQPQVPSESLDHLQKWQWDKDGLNVRESWDEGHVGQGQRVGVIDLGFMETHQDLAVDQEASFRFTAAHEKRPGRWGVSEQRREHGTFCAGLVAAQRNGHGVAGAAPEAELVLAGIDHLSQDILAEAILECLAAGLRVISCSMKPCTSLDHDAGNCADWLALHSILENAFDVAAERDACLFWATSNTAGSRVEDDPVCRREEIFAIGCLGKESTRGPGAAGEKIYLAPGIDLGSTKPREDGTSDYGSSSQWATSYATPCAAGVAVLLLEQDPSRSVADVHEILRESCREVDGAASHGAVDAGNAL